jgi:hypothetical protein
VVLAAAHSNAERHVLRDLAPKPAEGTVQPSTRLAPLCKHTICKWEPRARTPRALHCIAHGRPRPAHTARPPRRAPLPRFDVPNHRLKAWNEPVQRQLLQAPADFIPGFQDAIRDYIRGLDATRALTENAEIQVGVSGEFGELELSPRELASTQLGKLVKVGPTPPRRGAA